MAKDSPSSKPKTETPFQRFENLVRKIVRVPKHKVEDREDRKKERRSH
jgi:hypothetical protein